MQDDTYNGFTNRETSELERWLKNAYRYDNFNFANKSSEYFQGYMDGIVKKAQEKIRYTDLLEIGSLWRVNWQEVAEAFEDE